MSSLATLLAISKETGLDIGISYDQYLRLKPFFPNLNESIVLESRFCGDICRMPWQVVGLRINRVSNQTYLNNKIQGLKMHFPIGRALNFGAYINAPLIFKVNKFLQAAFFAISRFFYFSIICRKYGKCSRSTTSSRLWRSESSRLP